MEFPFVLRAHANAHVNHLMLIFNAWDGFANFLLTRGDTFVRIQLKLLLEVTQLSHASPFIFCPSGIIIQCKIQMGGEQ